MAGSNSQTGGRAHLLNGITRRWMFTNVFVFGGIVLIFLSVFSVVIFGYNYKSMQSGLEMKAQTAANFFSSYITKTYAEYYDSAYQYAKEFEDADIIELQFLNTAGKVMVSSYSTPAGTFPGTSEITRCLSEKCMAVWIGRAGSTNERIMAVSVPMAYKNGEIIGIMRYVTSMRLVDHKILITALTAAACGVALLGVILLTNMFFLRSVVKPVRDMKTTAQRIAEGSYGVQIPKNYNYKDEIAELVDAINEMSTKIGQAERTQTEFISSVSHELRTPLTAITGWAETLLYDESLNDDERRGISIVLYESQRLTKMVEELLDFTRIQDGRFTLNVVDMDLGEELEEVVMGYSELFRQENIRVKYDPYDGDLPMISGDPARLRQVILNLLDNASKYGRDGGQIDITVACDAGHVFLRIRDYGPGVPEDELEIIKKKFYKGNTKERGSGIGLAVCDEIVKYHGGTLTMSNARGGGLMAEVSLPIKETE